MGSQGNNFGYNSCTFAENEERSPWPAYHVQQGFKPTDSTVSIFGAGGMSHSLGLREQYWQDHVRSMMRGIGRGGATFLLDPITAHLFVERAGFDKVEKLKEWAYENHRLPAGEYWDQQLVQNYVYPRATFGDEPYATMLKAAPDELIHVCTGPDDIQVVVVGGEANGYWSIMGAGRARTISVDDWR
jgi:hypothetical protein